MTVASTLAILSLLFPPLSIFFFGIMSSATVALVTLRKGAYEGALVLIASVGATALLGGLMFKNFQITLGYGLALWLPIWLIATVLREGRQLALALEISTLLAAVGICGYYLFGSNPASTWFEGMKQMLEPALVAMPPEIDRVEVTERLEKMSHYMTGFFATGYMLNLILGLFLARWWQAQLYNPGGFRTEFLSLRINRTAAYLCLGLVALALSADGLLSELAWNVLILVFVLYLIAGTAVLHSLLAASKASKVLLPIMYVVMFFIPHALLPVALIGYGDTWLNLRSKVSG